jgi:SAM-dependent methyltransferase
VSLGAFVCPGCKGELDTAPAALECPACAVEYPIRDGIPCFGETDGFYDAYAGEHAPFVESPRGLKRAILRFLPFWSWREWRFWESAVPACERLLDCGCGRGRETFVDRARETVGFDASFRFARECAQRYDAVAQGSLPQLPFRSASFDVVVSSHLFGHIPFESKDDLVAEIHRVLRPGGRSAHLIETESDHPTVRAARLRGEAYRRQFVEQDGHVGLEPAERALSRFERRGFRRLSLRLVDALVPSRQNFRKYLAHPDFAELPGMRWLERLDRIGSAHPLANLAYEVGMGTLHLTAERWLGRPAFAQFVMVVFEK